MYDFDLEIIIVDTKDYSSWNDVKLLYNDLYAQLLAGQTIESSLLDTYQASLDELKTSD